MNANSQVVLVESVGVPFYSLVFLSKILLFQTITNGPLDVTGPPDVVERLSPLFSTEDATQTLLPGNVHTQGDCSSSNEKQ